MTFSLCLRHLLLFLFKKKMNLREKDVVMLLSRSLVWYYRDSFKSSYSRIQRRTEGRTTRWESVRPFTLARANYPILCLSVFDPRLNSKVAENEKFQAVKTLNRSRAQKSITRKSDGRKSSVPKKLSVMEDEGDVGENLESSRYSILGSYLNSGKTQTLVTTNINPAEVTPGSSGMKL